MSQFLGKNMNYFRADVDKKSGIKSSSSGNSEQKSKMSERSQRADELKLPGTTTTEKTEGRFRVDRINSLKAGCHRGGSSSILAPLAIPELDESEPSSEASIPYITEGDPHPSQQDSSSVPASPCSPTPTTPTTEATTPTSRILAPFFSDITEINNHIYNPKPGTGRRSSLKSSKLNNNNNNNNNNDHNNSESCGHRVSISEPSAIMVRRKTSVFLPEIDEAELNNSSTLGYGKSFINYTHDALPRMDNYRNLMSIQAAQRPTLDDLHDEDKVYKKAVGQKDSDGEITAPSATKFGWIEGVLVRCLLNIWGVMLFLRLSWMIAQAGIIQSLIIIAISTVVTTITTLSMAAVSTNGEMKGGGIYYMISRSLGPEWGGAIGVVFSFANAGMAALNIVGFSESLISLLAENRLSIVDGGQNDNRIISVIAVLVLQGIIVVGKEYEAKCQVGLLVILLVAMADFVVGAFMGPQTEEAQGRGWIGMNSATFSSNLGEGYRFAEGSEQNFFTIFSVFFPAVAGIQAGASISGDLKDAATAIPKGTLLAIFLTSASYAFFGLLAGAGTVRDATGNFTDMVNGTFPACANASCKWGLYNDFQVMNLMSAFGPLIYAGCFAATLSSALSCLVSGSEMFQALCKDKVYPYMSRFGKGYGKKKDPYYSYAAGFVVALIFILIADLNAIAPLISNFFMVTYALLNFCTFHASILKPLGWRPTFKYYNVWVSLIGAILCVAVMFLMSWVTALISFGCVIALYVVVLYRKPDINWGATTQAQTYQDALNSLQSLTAQDQHVKNYRPQILALTGPPSSRPTLVDFANVFTKKKSLLICTNISRSRQPAKLRRAMLDNGYDWLLGQRKRAFYVTVDNSEMDKAAKSLIQSTGLGKLAPNIILMGYKSDWQICERDHIREYFNILHEALDNYVAIAILRVKDGLDMSQFLGESPDEKENINRTYSHASSMEGYENPMEFDGTDPDAMERGESPKNTAVISKKGHRSIFDKKHRKQKSDEIFGVYKCSSGSDVPPDILHNLSLFTTKQPEGTIDVWWLYDDGGLTLLLPYIMSTRKNWASCKLRVFALSNKKSEIELEHRGMASLLSKFRIDYSDLTVIPDITKKAENSTKEFFDALIKDFKGDPEDSDHSPDTIITKSELVALREKTNRHLRLRELLLEHSSKSNFVVMTLPVPRKGTVSAPLYLAWLECLTRDMPPFLLVRGNQTSVLTFYS